MEKQTKKAQVAKIQKLYAYFCQKAAQTGTQIKGDDLKQQFTADELAYIAIVEANILTVDALIVNGISKSYYKQLTSEGLRWFVKTVVSWVRNSKTSGPWRANAAVKTVNGAPCLSNRGLRAAIAKGFFNDLKAVLED